MEDLSVLIKKNQIQTIVIMSPHGPMRYDRFTINLEKDLSGSFADFGLIKNEFYDFKGDADLGKKILHHLQKENFPIDPIREDNIDYGSLIPLHYLSKNLPEKPKIILLTYTELDWNFHFGFGKAIRKVVDEEEKNIAFIASGDLSHRLSTESPAGYSPYGAKFDQTLMELLKKNEIEKIIRLNPEFCKEIQECGLKSIITALGLLSFNKVSFVKLAYEYPLGVGYLTGYWKNGR